MYGSKCCNFRVGALMGAESVDIWIEMDTTDDSGVDDFAYNFPDRIHESNGSLVRRVDLRNEDQCL